MKSDNNVMRGCLQLRRYWMFINITIITVLELSMKEIGKGGWEQEKLHELSQIR